MNKVKSFITKIVMITIFVGFIVLLITKPIVREIVGAMFLGIFGIYVILPLIFIFAVIMTEIICRTASKIAKKIKKMDEKTKILDKTLNIIFYIPAKLLEKIDEDN